MARQRTSNRRRTPTLLDPLAPSDELAALRTAFLREYGGRRGRLAYLGHVARTPALLAQFDDRMREAALAVLDPADRDELRAAANDLREEADRCLTLTRSTLDPLGPLPVRDDGEAYARAVLDELAADDLDDLDDAIPGTSEVAETW